LPLDVVSIVAGFAALNPIFQRSTVNACFASSVALDGTFPEVFEDSSHTLSTGFQDLGRQFSFLALTTAGATLFAARFLK
jgi:hypothetical protein